MLNCGTRVAAAALAGLVALPCSLATRTADAAETGKAARTVSVSATGWVAAEPDIARISAGVVTEADAAKAAIARNNAAMARIIDGLKSAGIAAKDLQTTEISVEPRYSRPKEGRTPSIEGYRALNRVQVTVRDVKRVGELLDQAISLGANQLGRISFDVAEPERLMDEARVRAMENARRRAELYAKAAGAQLGPVLSVAESGYDMPQPAVMARAVPVEAGTRRLQVQVHVVYVLR